MGDLGFLYKINYSLRTALKILVPVLTFKAFNESKYYDKLFKFPWDEYMDADQTFAIDATVYSERYSHSQFMTLKMKDAIVDYFVAKHRKRPSIDTKNPDIKFHLHIDRELVTISMDSSGAPLFKRGYRKEQTAAPINEVLAAGMLQLAGWDGKGNFFGSHVRVGNSSYRGRNGSNGFTCANLQKRIRFYELEELRCRVI